MSNATHYQRRQEHLRGIMQRSGWSALLVTDLPNVRYLCGFTGSAGVLGFTRRHSAFFSDGRYRQQAAEEVVAQHVVTDGPPLRNASQWLARQKPSAIGYEGGHLSAHDFSSLRRAVHVKTRWKDSGQALEHLRMVKDSDEIRRIRRAAELGAEIFQVALQHLSSAARECDVAAEMEYAARTRGADGVSFETIVAGGKRSALPHGRASRHRLPRRGFVVIDFGVILAGYCSDRTRTVHLGKPGGAARRLYEAVQRAQEAALRRLRPGVTAAEVDRAAREVLEAAGWGRYFTHSTGHGVGLEIHEPPRLAAGQKTKLQPGMIVTIEPGAYVPGEGGVRIEDMALITDRGHEVLAPASKDLLVV